jgi:hypothetical protein
MTLNELDTKNTVAINWLIALSITVFVFPFVVILSIITVIPSFLALIPLFIGAPYFAFVAIYSAVKSKAEIPTGFVIDEKVLQFGTLRQQITLLANIILVVNLAGWALVLFLGNTGSIGFVVVVLTGFLGLLSIIVNIPLIYGKFYWSERIAKQEHWGHWKFIRASRILCWSVWSIYATISLIILFAGRFLDLSGNLLGVAS